MALQLFIVLLATAAGTARGADWLPQELRVRYELRALGTTVGETRWHISRPAAGELRYESVSEPAGLYALLRGDVVRESSTLRVDSGGLQAQRYRYSRTGGKRDRQVAVDFDWSARRVHNDAKGQRWSMDVPPGTLDKLGYLLAVMRDLGRGASELAYPVAGGGELETYRLRRLGSEAVQTPLGRFDAVRVERLDQTHRATTFWFAPTLAYLPVQVQHVERDDTRLTLQITAVEGLPRP